MASKEHVTGTMMTESWGCFLTVEKKRNWINTSPKREMCVILYTFINIYGQGMNLFHEVIFEYYEDRVSAGIQEIPNYRERAYVQGFTRAIASLVTGYVVLSSVVLQTLGEWSRTFARDVQIQHVPRLNPVCALYGEVGNWC